jgi:hypothetical protein
MVFNTRVRATFSVPLPGLHFVGADIAEGRIYVERLQPDELGDDRSAWAFYSKREGGQRTEAKALGRKSTLCCRACWQSTLGFDRMPRIVIYSRLNLYKPIACGRREKIA